MKTMYATKEQNSQSTLQKDTEEFSVPGKMKVTVTLSLIGNVLTGK